MAFAAPVRAADDDYPNHPVKIIVPFAPGGSTDVVARILKTEDVRRRFAEMGVEPVGGTQEDFAAHIRAESDKWGKLIRSANITIS